MRSHWGVEGDLPFGDSHYYYEQDHHHKDKKHKKHKKHKKYKKHHHDDDDLYNIDDSDASPYNELNNVPIWSSSLPFLKQQQNSQNLRSFQENFV